MSRGHGHHGEDTVYPFIRDFLMEKVAHAVHEDRSGLLPGQGKVKPLRPESQIKSLLEMMPRDSTPALCKDLGIAMLATRTDLRAASDGIPRGVGPFDGREKGHPTSPGLASKYYAGFVRDLHFVSACGTQKGAHA